MKRICALLFLVPMAAFAAERYTPPGYSGVLVRSQAPTTSVEMSSMPHPDPEEPPPPPPPPQPAPDIDITNTAEGGAGGLGGAGGQATGGSVGDLTLNGGGVSINYPRQVASAYAPSNYPSAMCQGNISAGAQFKLFGFSFGKNYTVMESCLMALAQQWMAMGEYALACEALMATNSANRAHEEETRKKCANVRGPASLAQSQPQSQPTIIVLPVGAPGADFDEKLKRAFEAAMASPK